MIKKITPNEIPFVSQYIRKISGIEVDEKKTYLLETRLDSLCKKFNFLDYSKLIREAQQDSSGKIRNEIIDAISTNETSFFRDTRPFNLLAHKIIPEHFERKGNHTALDIWSTASSTGQEIYSIAITLKELLDDPHKYRIKILGTDISSSAIKKASMGRYTKLELSRGLSGERLKKYFKAQGNCWQISDELRSLTQFRKINLLKPLTGIGIFNIILCRNVAIYFSPQNRKVLFENLAKRLESHGTLIIGSTESLAGVTDKFVRCEFHGASYYILK